MAVSFDNLFNKAKEVASAAGKVAGEVVDVSKAKIAEAKLNSEIKDAYERLGAISYDAIRHGKNNEQLRNMVISEIDGLLKELEQMKTQNAAVNSEAYCVQCGGINTRDAEFCCKCGAPMKKGTAAAVSQAQPIEATIVAEQPSSQHNGPQG